MMPQFKSIPSQTQCAHWASSPPRGAKAATGGDKGRKLGPKTMIAKGPLVQRGLSAC